MTTINDAFAEWNRQVQLPGTISLSQATDILQTFGPTITDTEGDDWWGAFAVYLGTDLNIITPATYVGLRNYADGNEAEANRLFDGLVAGTSLLPETAPIVAAIELEDLTQEQASIAGNITTIEGDKTGGLNQQLDDAYDQGINYLTALDERLSAQLGT